MVRKGDLFLKVGDWAHLTVVDIWMCSRRRKFSAETVVRRRTGVNDHRCIDEGPGLKDRVS